MCIRKKQNELHFRMEEYVVTAVKRFRLRFEGRGRRKEMLAIFREDLNLKNVPKDCRPAFPEQYIVPMEDIKNNTVQRDRIIAEEFVRLREVTKNLNLEVEKLRKTREYETKRKKEFEKRAEKCKKRLAKEKDEVERVALAGKISKYGTSITNQEQILAKVAADIVELEKVYRENDKIWQLQVENLESLHHEMCMELIRSETKRIREIYGYANFTYPKQPVAARYLKKSKELKEEKDA